MVGVPVDPLREVPLVAKPAIPPDRAVAFLGRGWPGVGVDRPVELAFAAVAAVTRLAPHHLADPLGGDGLLGFPELVLAGALRADLKHAAGLADRIAAIDRLLHRQRQRLLAVHILADFHRLDRHLGVPVIGRRDEDGVDVLVVDDLAVFHRPGG
jgi:hypothetical protein